MTTPTLSMQLCGIEGRRTALARCRHEAAKKAWATRRKNAKLSISQKKLLAFLMEPKAFLEHRSSAFCGFFLSCGTDTGAGCWGAPRQIAKATFRSLERRGLLSEREHKLGGVTTWTDHDGVRRSEREVYTIFRISEKGRKLIAAQEALD